MAPAAQTEADLKSNQPEGVHPQAAHAALALGSAASGESTVRSSARPVIPDTGGGQIHFSCPPPCGVLLPVPVDTVLNQGHFVQVRKEREIKRQRKVCAVEPDIADNVSAMPFIIIDFLYRQSHAFGCQQRAHDPCDKPVLNVIAIVAEGDGLQSGRFFTAHWLRMVPARKQAIGRKPPVWYCSSA